MRNQFRGWVPTVSGRLSFRIIGETNYPTAAEYSNVRIERYQYVFVRQSRNLSDVLFSWFLSRLLGVDGEWDFFLAARSPLGSKSPDARLIGKLYLFRTLSNRRQSIQPALNQLFEQYRSIERNPFDAAVLRDTYLQSHTLLSNNCEIHADIVLRRSGVVTISNIVWSNATERTNSETHAQDLKLDINEVIADQFYFFVRDVAHKHQHHSPDADTMITVHSSRGADHSWCMNVIYSLYFHIVTMKRHSDSGEHVRAMGVLAYISSFQTIAESLGCDPPQFFSANARRSIEASRAYIELKLAQRRKYMDTARTVVIAAAGFALTLVGLVIGFADNTAIADPDIVELANTLKSNAFGVLLLIPILGVVYYAAIMLVYGQSWSAPWRNFLRDVVRVLLYSRAVSATITIMLAAIAGWFVYAAWARLILSATG